MPITERQKDILGSLVKEYIDSARPVSSHFLETEYDFGVCPATIRNEMQKLTDIGFLSQPHTSAGRVPTDKGYRFFVDNLINRNIEEADFQFEIEEEIEDTHRLLQNLTRQLAAASSNLALSYLADEKLCWKEGWEGVFQKPEFKEGNLVSSFTLLLKNFEEGIDKLNFSHPGIKIYIGRENPFPKARDFSIIVSTCHFPQKEKGVLAILGPKRMPYDKNIKSLSHLTSLFEDF